MRFVNPTSSNPCPIDGVILVYKASPELAIKGLQDRGARVLGWGRKSYVPTTPVPFRRVG